MIDIGWAVVIEMIKRRLKKTGSWPIFLIISERKGPWSFDRESFRDLLPFSGSTGGCLEAAQVEETYLLTWLNETGCRSFELPTGGVFFMKEGRNLISFAKKEQCLALGFQLRELLKILNYQVFRIFPNKEIEYLYPNDGVFSEKASFGRVSIGCNSGTVGCNMEPVKGKFTSLDNFTYTRCDTILSEAEWYEMLVRMELVGSL
jgi:photosystem I subunit 2